MSQRATNAIQDYYPDDFSHCYGCGRLNAHGFQLKTRWEGEGEDTVARFTPRPEHIAVPGFVYGGVIASLIDCHAMGTAAVAAERAAGREIGDAPAPRFVTAALRVDFLKPTPLGRELEIRARVREASERKVVVTATVAVGDVITARGEVVAVRMPATMTAPT
ncbi:MAG: PaaI family thioesterase [Gemmatimonadales bacterium]